LSKIESDIARICAGRSGPAQSHGRERKRESGVGVGERIRELEVLLPSEKKRRKGE